MSVDRTQDRLSRMSRIAAVEQELQRTGKELSQLLYPIHLGYSDRIVAATELFIRSVMHDVLTKSGIL